MREMKKYLQVIFVVDATGSMQLCLDKVMNSIHALTLLFEVIFPSVVFRVILYRDYDCSEKEIIEDVHGSIEEIASFMRTRGIAKGGGDEEEAFRSAVHTLVSQNFDENAGRNLVIHITDANCRRDPTGFADPTSLISSCEPSSTFNEEIYSNLLEMDYAEKLAKYGASFPSLDSAIEAVHACPFDTRESELEQKKFSEWNESFLLSDLVARTERCLFLNFVMGPESEGKEMYRSFGPLQYFTNSESLKNVIASTVEEELLKYRPFQNTVAEVTNALQDVSYRRKAATFVKSVIEEDEHGLRHLLEEKRKITCRLYNLLKRFARTDPVVKALVDHISTLCAKDPLLRQLIKDASCETDELSTILKKYLVSLDASTTEVLVLTEDCPQEMLSDLTASLMNFNPYKITKLVAMKGFFEIVEIPVPTNDDFETLMYRRKTLPFLPLGLDAKTFLSLLFSLFIPIAVRSRRNIAVIALIFANDPLLGPHAREYLLEQKGLWLDLSLSVDSEYGSSFSSPENITPSFLQFVLAHEEFLQSDEVKRVQFLFFLQRVNAKYGDERSRLNLPLQDPDTLSEECSTCGYTQEIYDGQCLRCIRGSFHLSPGKCIVCKRSGKKFGKKQKKHRSSALRRCIDCVQQNKARFLPNANLTISLRNLMRHNQSGFNEYLSQYDTEIFNTLLCILGECHSSVRLANLCAKILRMSNVDQMQDSYEKALQNQISGALSSLPSPELVYKSRKVKASAIVFDPLLATLFPATLSSKVNVCILCDAFISPAEEGLLQSAQSHCTNEKCLTSICSTCDLRLENAFHQTIGGFVFSQHITCPACRSPRKGVDVSIPSMIRASNVVHCSNCRQLKAHSPRQCGTMGGTGISGTSGMLVSGSGTESGNTQENQAPLLCSDCIPVAEVCERASCLIDAESLLEETTDLSTLGVFACLCGSFLSKAETMNGRPNDSCNHLACPNERCSKHICGFRGCGAMFNTSSDTYTHMTVVHDGWGGRYGGHE